MHINSPLINVTSTAAKKEGQGEERVCREGRRGEKTFMYRGDRRWETHRTDDTLHFWEGLLETACPAWGLLMCCCDRCLGFTLYGECICSMSHMCDWQGYAPHPWIHLHQLFDLCVYNSHIQSHTNTHTENCTHKYTHTVVLHRHIHKLIRLIDRWVWQLLGVWRNSQENLSYHRHNSKRGWGDGAPVGAMIALCD